MKSITIDGWEYPCRVESSDDDEYMCCVFFEYADEDTELWVRTNSLDELEEHLESERADELHLLVRHPALGHLRLVV